MTKMPVLENALVTIAAHAPTAPCLAAIGARKRLWGIQAANWSAQAHGSSATRKDDSERIFQRVLPVLTRKPHTGAESTFSKRQDGSTF